MTDEMDDPMTMQDYTFHYPPELMQLLISTIPKLCPSKRDVLLFFRGAGVRSDILADLESRLRTDPGNIGKYEIARNVLTRVNEKGDTTLRERREIVKRVVEFEDFSTCWPNDRLDAIGLVAEIRRVVNVKDSFTRMNQERARERQERLAQKDSERKELAERKAERDSIKKDLFALFSATDPHKRGKTLEPILNRLFLADGILVQEAFTLKGQQGEGVVEQIDGVVSIDGHSYLVEMKWWNKAIGKDDLSSHLVTVYHRGQARGICISASGFTKAAISIAREGLQRSVFVLCKLEELVVLLESSDALIDFLRAKINAAINDKNPMFEPYKTT